MVRTITLQDLKTINNIIIKSNYNIIVAFKFQLIKYNIGFQKENYDNHNRIWYNNNGSDIMEEKIKKLEKRVIDIENRNKRVEGDKAWETSSLRKFLIIALTYIFAVLYLKIADTTNPFLGAVVPCAGFFLSTQTLNIIKSKWLSNRKK